MLSALQNNHSGMDISSALGAVLGGGGDLLSSLLDQDGDGKLGLDDAPKIGSSLFGEKR